MQKNNFFPKKERWENLGRYLCRHSQVTLFLWRRKVLEFLSRLIEEGGRERGPKDKKTEFVYFFLSSPFFFELL